ncbi:hypothetical protein R1flu_001162 [Riccia fluitans]|uniref:Uncharacterized protein n=1 Tax=Riccia fluitans TaxID=41844 RepID=A0ABD1Y5P7_9MARC
MILLKVQLLEVTVTRFKSIGLSPGSESSLDLCTHALPPVFGQGGIGLEYAYLTTKKHEQVIEPSTEDYSEVSAEDDLAVAPAEDAPPLKDSEIAQD